MWCEKYASLSKRDLIFESSATFAASFENPNQLKISHQVLNG